MNEYLVIADIEPVLEKKRIIPTITMWNRLEGRPRTLDFDRALQAEVRDALFMLTKQWQMGEFHGDDAGSPVLAKVHIATTRLDTYRPAGGSVRAFDGGVPLEAQVERRPLPFRAGDQLLSLDLRLLMGRHWLKLIARPETAWLKRAFVEGYPVEMPDPAAREDAAICAHQESSQKFAAAAGRAMDGAELYFHLRADPANRPDDRLTETLTEEQRTLLAELGRKFAAWFERTFHQPQADAGDAWLPSRLEYQFECSAPFAGSARTFRAEEYFHGHLDWYNFNVAASGGTAAGGASSAGGGGSGEGAEDAVTHTFIPVPVQFDGMPNTRWWSFEEGKTNFGDIDPDTNEIAKLLLIEFGLVYANDWFIVPVTLPAGSIATVKGMTVTNVFGERTWVAPAGSGEPGAWQRWRMFELTAEQERFADHSLMLLPTVPKIQEGRPVEEVHLIRDEVANMVWGIEARIPLPSGDGAVGREAALEFKTHMQRIVAAESGGASAPAAVEHKADIRYRLMSTVPEHWIPFIPVHCDGDRREIQLQRAAMPRILDGDSAPPAKVRPRTTLLREGLDREPKEAYLLYEEEVPRAGIRVYHGFQRTRWYDGKVFTWLGARKQTGRGEGSSGLAFDEIVHVKR